MTHHNSGNPEWMGIPVLVRLSGFPTGSAQAGSTIYWHQMYGYHGEHNSQNSLLFFNSCAISLRNCSLKGSILALGHLFTGPKGWDVCYFVTFC